MLDGIAGEMGEARLAGTDANCEGLWMKSRPEGVAPGGIPAKNFAPGISFDSNCLGAAASRTW